MTKHAAQKDVFAQILESTGFVFVATLFGTGSSFIVRFVLARHLGTTAYGLIVLGLTVLNVVLLLALLGFPESLPREIPRTESPARLFFSAAAISVPVSVIVAATLVLNADVIAAVLDEPQAGRIITIFAVSLPFYAVLRLVAVTFRGFKDVFGSVLAMNGLQQGGVMVIVVATVILGGDAIDVVRGWTGALIFGGVLAVVLLRKRIPTISIQRARRESAIDVRKFGLFSIPLMFSGIVWDLMRHFDNFLIGIFRESSAVGIYDAAYTLGQVIFIFLTAFEFLFLPIFSELQRDDERDQMMQFYQLVNKWLVIVPMPVFVGLALWPNFLMRTVFGSGFTSGTTLAIVTAGFYANNLGGFNAKGLITFGRSKDVFWAILGALVVNLVLNVTLIPPLGIVGAATASAISYVFLNTLFSWRFYRTSGIHQVTRSWVLSIALGVMAYTATFQLVAVVAGRSILSFVVAAIAGSLIYIVLLWKVVGLHERERHLLRRVRDRVFSGLAASR